MSGSDDTHAIPRDDVLFEATPDGGVLLDLETETYFQLDAVSAEIWTMLGTHGGSIDGVVTALVESYDAETARIDQETRDFCASLIEAGLARSA